jgi:transcriptional regulator with XRE-family HTH domain
MHVRKDYQTIGLMMKFVRHKRRLSQQEVADDAGINRAIVSLLESGNVEKAGFSPVRLIFGALQMHENSLADPSLYQLIKDQEKNKISITLESQYAEKADSIMKIYSAVFDSYCSLLPWTVNLEIARKSQQFEHLISSPGIKEALELKTKIWEGARRTGTPLVNIDILDYLPSYFILDLLSSLSKQDLLDIFSIAARTAVSNSETLENKIFADALSHEPFVLPLDPFKKLMEKIGVKYIDYFAIIDLITVAAEELRKSSLKNFKENVEDVVNCKIPKIFQLYPI